MKKNINKMSRGFTLIESLVSVSLFVIIITATIALFMAYSKAQKETGLRQKAINQLNFELERLVQDIRLKKIIFGGNANYRPGKDLYLLDEDFEKTKILGSERELALEGNIYYFFIKKTDNPGVLSCEGFLEPTTNRLYRYNGNNFQCEPIFLIKDVELTDVNFYISPYYNAYPKKTSDCYTNQFNGFQCTCNYSLVTSSWQNGECYSDICNEGLCLESQPVVTVSVSAQIGGDPNNVVTLQTSVSSRVYN